jgi:outer membrane protein assembly factor BamB
LICRTVLPLILCLLTLGCGGAKTAPGDWRELGPISVLRLRWVKPLYPSVPNFLIPEMMEEHDRFNPIETSSAGFDSDLKRAFIGGSVGGLYCVDLFSGETVWRFDLADPVGGTPLYHAASKTVFFGADNGKFYALHARSGRKLWETTTDAEIRRVPILYNGTLYAGTAANTIIALDPESGELIWQYRRPPVEGFASSGYAGITLHDGKLITGFSDGYVAAIDAVAGTVIWEQDLASEILSMGADGTVKLIDVDATPLVAGDILVAASVAGGVQGLDVDTGTVLWTRPKVTGVTGLAYSRGRVYTARSSHGLTALDPEDGSTLWSHEFETGVLQDPLVHEDVLLVTDSVFGLYVVSADTGQLMQRLDQRKGFFARPSEGGGYVLVIGNNGTLYAMSIL